MIILSYLFEFSEVCLTNLFVYCLFSIFNKIVSWLKYIETQDVAFWLKIYDLYLKKNGVSSVVKFLKYGGGGELLIVKNAEVGLLLF
jgi:hypothetical protein